MTILVLQHCPVTPVGLLGETLREQGADLDIRILPIRIGNVRSPSTSFK